MLEHLDVFLANFSHIISTVEAASTLAAVIVSLCLAFRASRESLTRIKATLAVGFNPNDPDRSPVVLTISNIGIRPAHFRGLFFQWNVPFLRKDDPATLANTVNLYIGSRKLVSVDVGKTAIEFIAEQTQFRELITEHDLRSLSSQMRFLATLRLKFLSAIIRSDDGRQFQVEIAQALKDDFANAVGNQNRHS